MPPKGWRKPIVGDVDDPDGLIAWSRRHVDDLRVRGYSERTITTTSGCLAQFTAWAFHRGISRPHELTKPVIESYRKALFHTSKSDGASLRSSSQRVRLQKLRSFCCEPRPGPRLVRPTDVAPAPKKRQRHALTVDGTLAVPDVPFSWELTLLSMYLATLLEADAGDDGPAPRA